MVSPDAARRRRCACRCSLVGEGQVGAPVRGGNGRVADGEVAHVQLVDRSDRRRSASGGLAQLIPAGRLQRGIVEVDDQTARGVRGQPDAVRVGDEIGLHRVDLGTVDLHLEQVAVAAPAGRPITDQTPSPLARTGIPYRRGSISEPAGGGGPRGTRRSRRPDRQRRLAAPPDDPRSLRRHRQIVEDAGICRPGCGHDDSGTVVGRQHHLPGQQVLGLGRQAPSGSRSAPRAAWAGNFAFTAAGSPAGS